MERNWRPAQVKYDEINCLTWLYRNKKNSGKHFVVILFYITVVIQSNFREILVVHNRTCYHCKLKIFPREIKFCSKKSIGASTCPIRTLHYSSTNEIDRGIEVKVTIGARLIFQAAAKTKWKITSYHSYTKNIGKRETQNKGQPKTLYDWHKQRKKYEKKQQNIDESNVSKNKENLMKKRQRQKN